MAIIFRENFIVPNTLLHVNHSVNFRIWMLNSVVKDKATCAMFAYVVDKMFA